MTRDRAATFQNHLRMKKIECRIVPRYKGPATAKITTGVVIAHGYDLGTAINIFDKYTGERGLPIAYRTENYGKGIIFF